MAQYDKAITDCSASLELNRENASCLYVRGLAKRHNHDNASGDGDIEAARTIDPKIAEEYEKYGVTVSGR
jgi:hypothetical protein